jgi:hypothetical protein
MGVEALIRRAIRPFVVAALMIHSAVVTTPVRSDGGSASESQLPLHSPLVALNSAEGRRLLIEAKAKEPFWTLAQNYQCQQDQGSCSVASCVMVLNALQVSAPESPEIRPFRRYTPANFFTEQVMKVTTQSSVSRGGMTLKQLHTVLKAFPITTRIVFAGNSQIDQFRQELKSNLSAGDRQIVVNYSRRALGQQGGGHISPVAAYNEQEDRVLVADTAGYKYPWTWIPVSGLWGAMAQHKDSASGQTRGYVVVSKAQTGAGTEVK